MRESPCVFACLVQEEGPPVTPQNRPPVRLPRILRPSEPSTNPDAVPFGRALLWGLFGVVLLVGLVLYFKYERVVAPLLS